MARAQKTMRTGCVKEEKIVEIPVARQMIMDRIPSLCSSACQSWKQSRIFTGSSFSAEEARLRS